MSNILERLDKLKAQMQDPDFQKGNGLSNEVNIHIFCYDPKDEMAVRYFTEQLVADQDVNCHVIEKNLYKILLKLCEDKRLLNKIPKLEETKGTKFILDNIQGKSASAKNFVAEICKDGFKEGDVLLITGVGEAYPLFYIRGHLTEETYICSISCQNRITIEHSMQLWRVHDNEDSKDV